MDQKIETESQSTKPDFENAKKETFLRIWTPRGYTENWIVYAQNAKMTETEFVDVCLKPFFNPSHTCFEVGCGSGYWIKKYFIQNFKHVVCNDFISNPFTENVNISYIEIPDQSFTCPNVQYESIDFVFSFGLFCHLSLDAIETYLKSIFKVCKQHANLVLQFSNAERRPGVSSFGTNSDVIPWVRNTFKETVIMLEKSGFILVKDLCPWSKETILTCQKP